MTTINTYDIAEERFVNPDAFSLYCENHHIELTDDNVDETIDDYQEAYLGTYDSLSEFAQIHSGLLEHMNDAIINTYFDWKSYANNEMRHDFWWEQVDHWLHAFRSL